VQIAVLLELGLVGLALWVLMYGLTLWRSLSLREQPGVKVSSCLVIYGLAAGMTEGSNFLSRPNENWFLIWIPLAILIGLSLQQRSRGLA
jgi:O-antigen ligase